MAKVHLLIAVKPDGEIGCVAASNDADEVLAKFKAIRAEGGRGWREVQYIANPLAHRRAKFTDAQIHEAKSRKKATNQ